MQALPCVQVRDLPPSASFYSAVSQPLGLRFVSANSSSIIFGNPDPTFEVKVAPAPKPTRIVLSASSPSVVSAFHAAARRANPNGNSHILLKEDDGAGGESRASATDLEGNVMELVYVPPSNYPPGFRGSTVRQTQSTAKEATRILGWNLDVAASAVGAARSAVGSAAPSRPGLATIVPGGDEESYRILRRSFTSSTVETSPPQQNASKGLSTGAMVGTMLGAVAAGAALGAGISYAFIKKERDRTPRQEFDAPPFQRRATYPEPHPDQQPRYVELERTVEKVRYPEQYPPGSNKYAHPAYTTRRPPASQPPSPPVEEVDSHPAPGTRSRDRSIGAPRKPLMITETEHKSTTGSEHVEPPRVSEAEHRSQASSRHSHAQTQTHTHTHTNSKSQLHAELFKRQPRVSSKESEAPDARSHVSSRSKHRSHASSRHSSHSHHSHHSHHGTVRPPKDDETYVSARSEKSASTVRPAKSSRSRSNAPSRSPSYVSARETSSPPKEVEKEQEKEREREAVWKDLVDDDDKASVAPSDSISCVAERPKPHARDIPFLQTRERIIIQ